MKKTVNFLLRVSITNDDKMTIEGIKDLILWHLGKIEIFDEIGIKELEREEVGS